MATRAFPEWPSHGCRGRAYCSIWYISLAAALFQASPSPLPTLASFRQMHATPPPTPSPTYYEALAADPELMQIEWDLPETIKFIKLAQYLKPYLSSMLRFADSHTAPPHLPIMIHDFFKFSLNISDEQVKVAWDGLRVAIWKSQVDDDDPITALSKISEYIQDLLIHGIVRDIGEFVACDLHTEGIALVTGEAL